LDTKYLVVQEQTLLRQIFQQVVKFNLVGFIHFNLSKKIHKIFVPGTKINLVFAKPKLAK
jgi:hypothetical protein